MNNMSRHRLMLFVVQLLGSWAYGYDLVSCSQCALIHSFICDKILASACKKPQGAWWRLCVRLVQDLLCSALPWMSSLKVQYLFLYLLRMRKALLLAKSSNWIRQFIPYLQDDSEQSDRITLATSGRLRFHSLICYCLHELIDQLVVLLPSDSLVLQSDVQGVVE